MAEQPSYRSSTLSQLLVVAISLYGIGALLLIWKGQVTLDSLKWLVEILLPLYGVKRGLEAMKVNGNGQPPPPPPATP